MYNHHSTANASWYNALNNTPGLVGPPIEKPPSSITQYFHEWLDGDGHPFWRFWENVRSWWAIRNLPNVHFVHFADLRSDMPGEIRRIAEFLEIPVDDNVWDVILLHCSFDYMKANATRSFPLGGAFWDGGAKTFIHKGKNGRWRDTLSEDEVEKYESRAFKELGQECATWLAAGASSYIVDKRSNPRRINNDSKTPT